MDHYLDRAMLFLSYIRSPLIKSSAQWNISIKNGRTVVESPDIFLALTPDRLIELLAELANLQTQLLSESNILPE